MTDLDRVRAWLDDLRIDGGEQSLACPLCGAGIEWGEPITPDPQTEAPGSAWVEDAWCPQCDLAAQVEGLGRWRELLTHLSVYIEDLQLWSRDAATEHQIQVQKEDTP